MKWKNGWKNEWMNKFMGYYLFYIIVTDWTVVVIIITCVTVMNYLNEIEEDHSCSRLMQFKSETNKRNVVSQFSFTGRPDRPLPKYFPI